MKYVIIYWTRHGNNGKIVERLKGLLETKGEVRIFKTGDVDPGAMPEADCYIFSSATEAFRLQENMRSLMKNLRDMEGKKYGIINTHRLKKNKLRKMEKMLNKKSMLKIAETDFAMGGNFEAGDGLQEGWEKKLETFAGRLS